MLELSRRSVQSAVLNHDEGGRLLNPKVSEEHKDD